MVPAPEPSLPPGSARHNLPVERTSLIGRERARAAIAQALAAASLVTLTGVGGGGKTRLARAVAADLAPRYPDGAWLVELAAIAEPALLPAAVAAALDLRLPPEGDPAATVLAYLRPRALLLVLDNCEHLIAACAHFAAAALAAAPGLHILATSREPLRVPGERQHRLAPLAAPDPTALPSRAALARVPAVCLFVERAQAADPDFLLTPENAALVAGICARLDGIPLALELAAARVGVLALGQILARLDDSVRLLTGGSRAGPTRQQTLRAALAWGDALLTPGERALFRCLAVFAGGWDLAAAEAVGAGGDLAPADVLEVLARLVDKSLALATTGPQDARYRLLEPLRQFAAEQLRASGEEVQTRERHVAHYLALAEQSAVALRGPAQRAWQARLEREQGNLRAALAWAAERGVSGDPDPGLRLATALVPFWEERGLLREGRRWLDAWLRLPATGGVSPAVRTRALTGAGRLAYMQGEYADAATLATESLALARALDDRAAVAAALVEFGMTLRQQGERGRALQHFEEALAHSRALGDQAGIALALLSLGATMTGPGDAERSARQLEECLAIYRALGDLRHAAIARSMLGLQAVQDNTPELAAAHLAASLSAHQERGDRWWVLFDLLALAESCYKQGRVGESARLLGAVQTRRAADGGALAGVGRVPFASFLKAIEPRLGEPMLAAAWAAGRALPPDRAVEYALALAGAAPAAPPQPPRPVVDALTRREREVALLVARGHSDRQVGAALSISTGTASVHVHRILAKLALRSRHQLAAWATAQGLAPPSLD